ncbi:MAG: glycosyltransferase [Dehalococcoidia bacterium]|nr:glycosyltransferase [Dehalococcoidia bacterium]
MPQILFLDILFYIQSAIVVSLVVLLTVSLFNMRYLRHLDSYPAPPAWPRCSVLVPARNEEANIGGCAGGLLDQDYPDFQVIVLDDNSTDRTWQILQELAAKDTRLALMKGKPLPDDWLGKHWACSQLAEAADGELLVFVDADTYHEPGMLRGAASAMIAENTCLISALPRQIVASWSELLSIPAFYLGMLCGVPLELTRLQRNPLLFAILGQFLVFRRDAYDAAGGYAAVRHNVVDDIAIGRRVHAMGLKYKLLDGGGLVSCRMYRNFDQVWKGLTKSTFATFNFDPYFLILMYTLVLIFYVSPPIVLGIGLSQPQIPLEITAMAGIAVVLNLVLWTVSNIRFHFPLYVVLFYPFSAIFMTVVAFASMILTMQGKALWKGRIMPRFVKL